MLLRKRICNKLNAYIRYFLNQEKRKRLIKRDITIISSNCLGGFMLHDLNLRFNSPFINLYLTAKDFIRYLQNIEFYQSQPLEFIQTKKAYPVGKLADLHIHFMHYHNEQEAHEKWQQRSQRMNLENLFIIMTDRDGCTYQDLVEFDTLSFNNKVVFTSKSYPELKSAVKISGFEQEEMVGDLSEYTGFNGKRYYDQFDYVAWFNKAN
ncbi:DUF1919 domain-containing protein [Pasteurella sp. P03HT]